MQTITELLAQELNCRQECIANVIALLDEGNTIPFIARYRKEQHGAMDDTALRTLETRLQYLRNLAQRREEVKASIAAQEKLTDELAKREAALRRMEDTQSENQYLTHELNGMKKRLLSFEEFAKDAQPEALFTLVHSIVDRIYITTDGTKQKCQVYIKGCATEDYSDVLGAAGYIEEEPLLPVVSYMPPMCDLDYYSIRHLPIR